MEESYKPGEMYVQCIIKMPNPDNPAEIYRYPFQDVGPAWYEKDDALAAMAAMQNAQPGVEFRLVDFEGNVLAEP